MGLSWESPAGTRAERTGDGSTPALAVAEGAKRRKMKMMEKEFGKRE